MPDARLADPHRLLVALEELGIVVKGTDFPLLQQPAIAGVVFDRRQWMRVKVEDLELEPGGGLEPVHHPRELRAADQDAKLALLRFCLHDADRPLKVWFDLQGNNAVTAENLLRPRRHSPNSG